MGIKKSSMARILRKHFFSTLPSRNCKCAHITIYQSAQRDYNPKAAPCSETLSARILKR